MSKSAGRSASVIHQTQLLIGVCIDGRALSPRTVGRTPGRCSNLPRTDGQQPQPPQAPTALITPPTPAFLPYVGNSTQAGVLPFAETVSWTANAAPLKMLLRLFFEKGSGWRSTRWLGALGLRGGGGATRRGLRRRPRGTSGRMNGGNHAMICRASERSLGMFLACLKVPPACRP
jgi:hypothetical protein